jgi:uncharacterized membrane protein
MTTTPPVLTEAQRKTVETLAKIRMAWVALWFALGLFSIAFIVFVLALFLGKSAVSTGIVGVIDGILAWTLKTVYSNLFPPPRRAPKV